MARLGDDLLDEAAGDALPSVGGVNLGMCDDLASARLLKLCDADACFAVIGRAAEMFGSKYDLHGDSSFARIVTHEECARPVCGSRL